MSDKNTPLEDMGHQYRQLELDRKQALASRKAAIEGLSEARKRDDAAAAAQGEKNLAAADLELSSVDEHLKEVKKRMIQLAEQNLLEDLEGFDQFALEVRKAQRDAEREFGFFLAGVDIWAGPCGYGHVAQTLLNSLRPVPGCETTTNQIRILGYMGEGRSRVPAPPDLAPLRAKLNRLKNFKEHPLEIQRMANKMVRAAITSEDKGGV